MTGDIPLALVVGNWILIGFQQWTVEAASAGYLRLRLAKWHHKHALEAGADVEISGESWKVSAAYERTLHLRAAK